MAEQLLNGPRSAPPPSRCVAKLVAQRVRRRVLRQAGPAAVVPHRALRDRRVQAAALGADEQRRRPARGPDAAAATPASASRTAGSSGTIRSLRPFPAPAARRRARRDASRTFERQRLGDAQPGAIEQGEQRRVPRLPARRPRTPRRYPSRPARACAGGQRARQPAAGRGARPSRAAPGCVTPCRRARKRKKLRTAERCRARVALTGPAGGLAASQARRSAWLSAARPQVGFRAEMPGEEAEETGDVAPVGFNGQRRGAPLAAPASPGTPPRPRRRSARSSAAAAAWPRKASAWRPCAARARPRRATPAPAAPGSGARARAPTPRAARAAPPRRAAAAHLLDGLAHHDAALPPARRPPSPPAPARARQLRLDARADASTPSSAGQVVLQAPDRVRRPHQREHRRPARAA